MKLSLLFMLRVCGTRVDNLRRDCFSRSSRGLVGCCFHWALLSGLLGLTGPLGPTDVFSLGPLKYHFLK